MNLLEAETIYCPYCGESNTILVDRSLTEQSYVEDCSVCCRPISLHISCDPDITLVVKREDE
jgi:hypothetical protein